MVIRNWVKYLAERGLADLNAALIELPKYGRQPPQLDERLPLMLKVEPPAPDPWPKCPGVGGRIRGYARQPVSTGRAGSDVQSVSDPS